MFAALRIASLSAIQLCPRYRCSKSKFAKATFHTSEPQHCHPQGYTQAEDDVIEQACASQMSITRRIQSQPAHPLRWEHQKPGEDRGGRSVEDGAEGGRR